MKRKLYLTMALVCYTLLTVQAQFTANISGQLNNKTGGSGGIQKVNYQWFAKAGSVPIDSGQGFFMSNSAGAVSNTVYIPGTGTYSVYFFFTMKNCDSFLVSKMDTCSAATPNISFTMRTCGYTNLNINGSMHDHWKKPYPYALIHVRYDSAGISSTQRIDSFYTDSLGVFFKVYNPPSNWTNGKIKLTYGCNGEVNVDSANYQFYPDFNGDRTANAGFWQRNYCKLKGSRAVFSGYIRDSLNNPVPNYSFTVRADSVFNADSMILGLKTNSNGYYADSISIDSTKTSVAWQYRLQTCAQTQIYNGRTTLINKIARTQYNIVNCGRFDWNLLISWYGLDGNPDDSADVEFIIYDTLGNPIDSFINKIFSGVSGGVRTIPFAYSDVDVSVRYPSCNGWMMSQKLRASRAFNDIWNFDRYPFCPDINIRTRLIYQNDTVKIFTGRLYLIRMDTVRIGSVLDTILTAVDSLSLSNQKSATFTAITGGTYYIKFAAGTTDPDYARMLPTYMSLLDSPVYWKDASPLSGTVKDSTYERTIRVRTGSNPGGPGFIAGSLSSGANKKANPIAGVDIILFDANLKPVRFLKSEGSGAFAFNGVAVGTWYILVDVPGRTASLRKLEITPGSLSVVDVNFKVHKKYVENVDETGLNKILQHSVRVYPNPANNEIQLELSQGYYDLSILTVQGQELIAASFKGTVYSLDLSALTRGIYILRTVEKVTGTIGIQKLIVE